jgi:transcriptional regulator with GAF, ATPase, and Fis domain
MVKQAKKVEYVPVEQEALPDVRKTPQMVSIEQEYGEDIRLIIKRLYEETGSQKATATVLGLEQSTMTIWALRLGIKFTQRPFVEIAQGV